MRVNGLTLIYKDGINTVLSNNSASYPVGDLLCRIFQDETLYNISRIVRNCVSVYPMRDILLSQDEIEQAEDYILQSLMYDKFYPARHLSQGSFIRCIEEYRSLDSASQSRLIQEEKQRAEMGGQFFKDIGFNTIGEFLQLCFNNYYVDLINGTSLFTATSAVWSGTATEEERALYDELCEALQDPHWASPKLDGLASAGSFLLTAASLSIVRCCPKYPVLSEIWPVPQSVCDRRNADSNKCRPVKNHHGGGGELQKY